MKWKQVMVTIAMSLVGSFIGFATTYVLLTGERATAVIQELSLWAFILSLVVSFYLQILLHESGHLLAGLSQRFSFCSIAVGSVAVEMEGARPRLKWKSNRGLGGLCAMFPRDEHKLERRWAVFSAGGIAMNALTAAVGLSFLFTVGTGWSANAQFFLAANVFVALLFVLVNAIPFQTAGVKSDGAQLLGLIRRSPKDVAEFQLARLSYRVLAGESALEIEESLFAETPLLPDHETSGITLNVYRMYRAFYSGDVNGAIAYADRVEAHIQYYPVYFRPKLVYHVLFRYALLTPDAERFREWYAEVESYIRRDHSMEAYRVKMVHALFLYQDARTGEMHRTRALALQQQSRVKGEARLEKILLEHTWTAFLAAQKQPTDESTGFQ